MNNFLVYKSSAGSGKTTTLIKEYLKLTLKNPALFSSVLAITFTNKAANEMKTRILETIREIISGNTSEPIIENILNEAGLTPNQAITNANRLLFFIDHHYDEFSVSTIDSFVYKIIRTFAGDLGLPQNFEVVIEKDDFVPFIVEDIYKKVGIDSNFTKILTRFVLSQVEEEKNHNISTILSEFVENQLKEENFFASLALENLHAPDFITIIKQLGKGMQKYRKQIVVLGNKAFELIEKTGLTIDDFSNRKSNGAISYFLKAIGPKEVEKLAMPETTKRTFTVFENDEGWYIKTATGDVVSKIESVKAQLIDYYHETKKNAKEYLLRKYVFNNIYQVALIHEIRSLFKQFIEQTQKVPISEFNKRIATEIAGQPVPYLYERLGHRYSHFMVDEFQDTSVLQWNNLLPLIEESLAYNHFNMIVGDAKQAIYRFRGGEVELFTNLPKLYEPENNPENKLREQTLIRNYASKPLDVNYRSQRNIIDFNNQFFEVAKQELSSGFKVIYNHHEQKIPLAGKEGGLISFRLIQTKIADEYREFRLREIDGIVTELVDKGYPWNKMSILCRSNKDASSIATHLLQQNIPIVSSESVKLISSLRVRFLVSFLRYLENPARQINLTNLTRLFLGLQNKEKEFHSLFSNPDFHFQDMIHSFGFENFNIEKLSYRMVYEICEELVRRFFGKEPIDAFTRFFLDFVFEKQVLHHGDVRRFLELWDDKSNNLSISLPENTDAVQIMTAHKAKGLKFGVVIVDLESFQKKNTKKQYWDSPDIKEIQQLKNTLFDINQNLDAIDRGGVYEKETEKSKLDFLNLVYVAFTRPMHALYAIGHVNEKGKGGNFGHYLIKYLEARNLWNSGQLSYQFGQLPALLHESDKLKINRKLLTFSPQISWNKHLLIAAPEQKPHLNNEHLSERAYGTLLHDILANVIHSSDLPKALTAFECRGIINRIDRQAIEPLLQRVLLHPKLVSQFNKTVNAKTETELYDNESKKYLRPDRVVLTGNKLTILDYKTGKKEEKHKKQIFEYSRVFSQMGFEVIKLLLVYIAEEVEVVEVS